MTEDLNNILLAIAGFLFVIALIALTAWGFKAFVLSGGGRSGSGFLRSRDKRLGVIEVASVDKRRRLLLVRRDDVEHLIMIGGPVDMVIETGIFGRRSMDPALQDVVVPQPVRPEPHPLNPLPQVDPLGPPPDFGRLWPPTGTRGR
jgi:flagellar protein FliO/FliZ